jgi:hypothetical protein
LNVWLNGELQKGQIEGLELPRIGVQQTILQYADDTSLSLRGEEHIVKNTITMFNTFNSRVGLTLNWDKSMAYHWELG